MVQNIIKNMEYMEYRNTYLITIKRKFYFQVLDTIIEE